MDAVVDSPDGRVRNGSMLMIASFFGHEGLVDLLLERAHVRAVVMVRHLSTVDVEPDLAPVRRVERVNVGFTVRMSSG